MDHRKRGLSFACIVSLLSLCVASVLVAQQATSSKEPPLTNQDVVKLCKLGLGDEVVIAKINQAPEVQFQLDVDSLANLKQQGVSKAVIEAMLKRASAPASAPSPAPAAGGTGGAGTLPSVGEEGVWLKTSQGEIRLSSVLGDASVTSVVVAALVFLDFPGLKAEVRISDRRPQIVVKSSKNPRGRIFLVRADIDEDDNVRSVKIGRASMFGVKSWTSPDKDWTVECDVAEIKPGTWELTPKTDLKPGEYGLLFRAGFGGQLAPNQGELFDFGVD